MIHQNEHVHYLPISGDKRGLFVVSRTGLVEQEGCGFYTGCWGELPSMFPVDYR
jgi:hypothetical protein